MRAFDGAYPRDLEKVVAHAKRLTKVLTRMERDRSDTWFVGRSVEVRGVVTLALTDWRAGMRDAETTGQAIGAYLDTLHRGASKKLRSAWALECCEPDEVITALGGEEARWVPGWDTGRIAPTPPLTTAPTVQTGWVDSAEMLERVQGGLGLVESRARTVLRRVGQAAATLDDLRAFGREGLLDAARTFDERRGVPFEGWASLRIRNAMIDGVRRWGLIPPRARRPTRPADRGKEDAPATPERGAPSGSTDASSEAPVGERLADVVIRVSAADAERLEGLGPSPEEAVSNAQRVSLLRDLVAELPHRQRELVERSYFEGQKLDEAAASMGVSRSWAYRVHAQALETMQRELRKRESRPVRRGGKEWGPRKS